MRIVEVQSVRERAVGEDRQRDRSGAVGANHRARPLLAGDDGQHGAREIGARGGQGKAEGVEHAQSNAVDDLGGERIEP